MAKYPTAAGGLTRHARELRRDLEELQQDREARPRRTGLVANSVHDATWSCADHSSTQMIKRPYVGAVIHIETIGHYLAATRPSQGTAT
ncbi:hypothetical protein [Brevibacterium aurantiacum]|uniref:hypothetical protein n=1 Tax=Brevibacterium aurantiacum TaxID=273384 RepID=UPI0016431C92|nr:hypothetical protein [Brevibacterium aurantiacum]